MFQVINAVAFEEREDHFSLEQLVLALLGSSAKHPYRFNIWSINTYKMEFN